MKPHKHAELIKAWADGAEIQISVSKCELWEDALPDFLVWNDEYQYRIKPEPKPCNGFCGEQECKENQKNCERARMAKKLLGSGTPQTKRLSDEVFNKAFDFYCETDEGVLRFDLELRAEWKQEQLQRWKEAFRKAWD